MQFAHRTGLRVIAICGEKDATYVGSLGANQVLTREGKPFEDGLSMVDAVIDLVGGDVQQRSFRVLRRGGSLISAVSQPNQDAAIAYGIAARFFLVVVTTGRLETIAKMMAAGEVVTRLGAVLPLTATRKVHEMLDGTQPRPSGKIVLQVAG